MQERQDTKSRWVVIKKICVELNLFLIENNKQQGDTQWEKLSWDLHLQEDPIF